MQHRRPYYKTETPERPLTARLEIRLSPEERIRIEQFCEERGQVVSEYVRSAVAQCIKLTQQQEKWARDRAALDDLTRRLVPGGVRTPSEETRANSA